MVNTCGIYGIFDLEGTCLYVGQSRTVELRWKRHLSSLRAGSHRRKDFVKWYAQQGGPENLQFQILEELATTSTDEELNTKEICWFENLSPLFYGKLPSTREVWEHSDITKLRISEGLRNYHSTQPKKVRSPRPKKVRSPRPPSVPKVEVEIPCLYCQTPITSKKRTQSHNRFCGNSCSSLFNSKLTPEQREEIRSRYPKESLRNLGREFGVSHISIRNIVCST